MDREKKDELPKMQVGFIDAICLPIYKVSGHGLDMFIILRLKQNLKEFYFYSTYHSCLQKE